MRDIYNRTNVKVAVDNATIASDTTTVGNIIDRKGAESLMFVMIAGTITDGAYLPLVEHGDDSGLSDAAAVPDAQLIGTEAEAAFALADDDETHKIGYVGDKRYVRLSIVSSATTTGVDAFGAVAVEGAKRSHGAAV